VTARVSEDTERVDLAIRETIDRIDGTADRVRARVRLRGGHLVAVLCGIRAAIETVLAGARDDTRRLKRKRRGARDAGLPTAGPPGVNQA
jgi:hypothetical protein